MLADKGANTGIMIPNGANEEIPEYDLREIINLNVKCVQFFGYFHPDKLPIFKRIIYHIYAISFVGVAYVLYMVSEIINMIKVFNDMEQVTNASFLLLTHLVQVPKIITLNICYRRVRNLLNSINRPEFKPKSLQQYKNYRQYVKMSKGISVTFLLMCVATCSLWGLFPFFDGDELYLPLSGWYPFNTSYSPVFELTYTYQVFFSAIDGLGNISMDTLFSGLIMFIAVQLKNLNDSFVHIREYSEKRIRLNEEKRAGADTSANDNFILQKEMDKFFQECITHHHCILDFAKEYNSLFTWSILGQFCVSVVIICITMFQITLVPVVSIQFFSLALYQSCMLLEIFLLCFYGNEAILQSMELTKSAYTSDWLRNSIRYKKNLVFFMTRSQFALKLYAGGFFSLSLETFVTILKSSWSYFAVLNHVHSK